MKNKIKQYLDAVKNDLEEIEKKAENAREKIDAVSDAFRFYDGGLLLVSSPSSIFLSSYGYGTNFSVSGYKEFADWPFVIEPRKPDPYYSDEYDWIKYKRKLLDLAATADAYIEDGNHYIRNCAKDHELVRQKGLTFISYLEALESADVELELDIY